MIRYDPEGEHVGWDLKGWWVCIKGEARLVRWHQGTSVFVTANPSSSLPRRFDSKEITGLLGISRPRLLHPQEVADSSRARVYWSKMSGEWFMGVSSDSVAVSDWLIEPFDQDEHSREYEPRPIYEETQR